MREMAPHREIDVEEISYGFAVDVPDRETGKSPNGAQIQLSQRRQGRPFGAFALFEELKFRVRRLKAHR
jgi:hypothetical protein